MEAGDCAVFATSLLHDAAAWTEDYHRINMFQRYTLSAYFNENPYSNALPHEDQRSHISDAMYELVSSPSPASAPVRSTFCWAWAPHLHILVSSSVVVLS